MEDFSSFSEECFQCFSQMCCRTRKNHQIWQKFRGNEDNNAIFTIIQMAAFGTKHDVMFIVVRLIYIFFWINVCILFFSLKIFFNYFFEKGFASPISNWSLFTQFKIHSSTECLNWDVNKWRCSKKAWRPNWGRASRKGSSFIQPPLRP